MRFTDRLEQAVKDMLTARANRIVAKRKLRDMIIQEDEILGRRPSSETVLTARVEERAGKEWATRVATGDYVWEQQHVLVYGTLEMVDLLRELVASNEKIIHILEERLPRKIY